MIDIIFTYFMLALLCLAGLLTIFMVPIGDWMYAREKRKKAEAAAKSAAAAGAASPSAPPSTPEPA
ncbi:MAG: hypothetical protein OXU71_10555 [Gammaproteobacteria bacterium]|nr:hypothetical protein [Gammaproteobacteria bacterium]